MKKRRYTQTQGKNKYIKEVSYRYDTDRKCNVDCGKSVTIKKILVDEVTGLEKEVPVLPKIFIEDDYFIGFLNMYYERFRHKNMGFKESIVEYLGVDEVNGIRDIDPLEDLFDKVKVKQCKRGKSSLQKYKGDSIKAPDYMVIYGDNKFIVFDETEDFFQILEVNPFKFFDKFYNSGNCEVYYLSEKISNEYEIKDLLKGNPLGFMKSWLIDQLTLYLSL